jgi:hypothetical protein
VVTKCTAMTVACQYRHRNREFVHVYAEGNLKVAVGDAQ